MRPPSNSTVNPEDVVQRICQEVGRRGFVALRGSRSIGSFYHLSRSLGTVLRVEDIRLGASRRGAHSAVGIGLHTDQAHVDWIAWYCRRPDPDPQRGATMLVDTAPLLATLRDEDRQALSNVIMLCPDVDDAAPPVRVPLLALRGGTPAVYYAKWNVAEEHGDAPAFLRFAAAADAAPRSAVRLDAGEILIADNRRMLHARDALDPASPRCLLRFWLRRDAPDQCDSSASSRS
jgi:hypothetical protein